MAATLLSCISLSALFFWGRRLVGGWAALGGTVFAAFLPVVWVNGGRAFSDSPSTAFFLASLAALAAATERASDGRRARPLALVAGLAAAAGAGVRPHLVLVFGPLLLVETVRLWRDRRGRPAAEAFVVGGARGNARLGALAPRRGRGRFGAPRAPSASGRSSGRTPSRRGPSARSSIPFS